MPAPEIDATQMAKYVTLGSSLVEVGRERARQVEYREQQPGAPFAKLLVAGYNSASQPEVQARILAAAETRAFPKRRPPPQTEMDRLRAEQVTSAQAIGNHRIPELIVPLAKTASSKERSELDQMREVFGVSESSMVGFHHDFSAARRRDAINATALVGTLSRQQVARDPALKEALARLHSHVQSRARVQNHSGVPHGIRTRD